MQLASGPELLMQFVSFLNYHFDCRYAHLLPKDDEAFEHYNSFSSKRLDEVFML